MAKDISFKWRQEAPTIYAAYALTGEEQPVYAGYVAQSPDVAEWRGYVGVGFTPVGRGSLGVMRRVVEQHAVEALEQAEEKVSGEQHS